MTQERLIPMRAAVITRHGEPDVLSIIETAARLPRPGSILVRVEAAGLNFHDVIERSSGYPGQELPLSTGLEGAGTIIDVGDGVSELAPGQRVMWAAVQGSHAEYVEVPAAVAIPVPAWLDSPDAAAICSQGLTAHYLASSLRTFEGGETALVWAAAGGVGRLLTQILAFKGVKVVAATSSQEKADVARNAGASLAVLNEDVSEAVAELTGGEGVDVIFDGVGAPTFETSLDSVRRRGLLVVYGRAGGQVPAIDIARLSGAGSVGLVRPRLVDFIATRDELLRRADEILGWLRDGTITVKVDATFDLDDIASAHRLLESRSVIGKVVIRP